MRGERQRLTVSWTVEGDRLPLAMVNNGAENVIWPFATSEDLNRMPARDRQADPTT